MNTSKKCRECGKSISAGMLCETCEKNVLAQNSSSKLKLTLFTGLLFAITGYIIWNRYQDTKGGINYSITQDFYTQITSRGDVFVHSNWVFLPAALIFIIFILYAITRIAK